MTARTGLPLLRRARATLRVWQRGMTSVTSEGFRCLPASKPHVFSNSRNSWPAALSSANRKGDWIWLRGGVVAAVGGRGRGMAPDAWPHAQPAGVVPAVVPPSELYFDDTRERQVKHREKSLGGRESAGFGKRKGDKANEASNAATRQPDSQGHHEISRRLIYFTRAEKVLQFSPPKGKKNGEEIRRKSRRHGSGGGGRWRRCQIRWTVKWRHLAPFSAILMQIAVHKRSGLVSARGAGRSGRSARPRRDSETASDSSALQYKSCPNKRK